jgi:DNA-binding beta-propeller fold protein YncE
MVGACAAVLLFVRPAPGDELEALKKILSTASEGKDWAPTATLPPFSAWVTSLVFSPDGQTLYVGGKDQVAVVNVADRTVKATLAVKVGQVRSLAMSPDGKTLAAGGYQKLQLWDLDKAAMTQELKGHRGVITAAAFSPDGKRLATSSDDETARIWNLADGQAVVLQGHSYPVMGVAWNHAGSQLVTIAGDETRPTKGSEAFLWDAAGMKQKEWTDHTKAGLCAAFSPDDHYLITGGLDDRAIVYDLQAGKALGYYGGHQRPVNALVFAPDGKTVASIGGGRNKGGHLLKLWNREDGDELATGEFHEAKILALAMSTDGKLVATGGQDNTVALWTPPAPKAETVVAVAAAAQEEKFIRVGVIGLDTSHAPAFAKLMNDPKATEDVAGCKVVAAYPKGSPDIESSTSRVPGYTEEFKKMGIEIVDSIPALLEKVDCVLLETNDGRPHLEQVLPVLKAGKPCFIDKPIAGSLTDAVAIFQAAKHYKVPVFSSSSLRYTPTALEARAGKYGVIHSSDAFSPASLEKTHPDLFWYGIHGVELLFTTMGTGCETVARTHTEGLELCVGVWKGGRIGTFRGLRVAGASGYGGKMFTAQGIKDHGTFAGYRPLAVEIVKFFKTKTVPITEEETLEIYAFMEAADESQRQGGKPVKLADVLEKAQTEAQTKLADLLK